MESKAYVKLKDLIGSTFEVKSVPGYTFKRWNDAEKKMEVSDLYREGFRKLYQVETNKGWLDMGSGQIGSLLEAVFTKGTADLIGRTFEVKSNGKSGIDIRYFFNVLKEAPIQEVQEFAQDTILEPDEVDLSDIPF